MAVTCINFGQITPIEIRRLKARTEFTCRRCGGTFEQVFINALEPARAGVSAARNATVQLAKKRGGPERVTRGARRYPALGNGKRSAQAAFAQAVLDRVEEDGCHSSAPRHVRNYPTPPLRT